MLDVGAFLIEFIDHLAPKLDTYEQAIYLYLIRHSRLVGKEEVTVGFKSARRRMACGIGEKGKPMSEGTAYLKLQSLANKGCVKLLDTERKGRRLSVRLPGEIPGVVRIPSPEAVVLPECLDFFNDPTNRTLILEREGYQCFYCLRRIGSENHVIEHVVSRPSGDDSYRNVVAACRECNNRKGPTAVEDFIRGLYRDSVLSQDELKDRLGKLSMLLAGDLKPDFERARQPQESS